MQQEWVRARWFIGGRRFRRRGSARLDVFASFREPTEREHGRRYVQCHGPYANRQDALDALMVWFGARVVTLLPPDPSAPMRMTYEF